MESLEQTVLSIVNERKRMAGLRRSEEDLNADLRREYELYENRYEGRVPFSLVALDAKLSCGSTLQRPSFVDPRGRNA